MCACFSPPSGVCTWNKNDQNTRSFIVWQFHKFTYNKQDTIPLLKQYVNLSKALQQRRAAGVLTNQPVVTGLMLLAMSNWGGVGSDTLWKTVVSGSQSLNATWISFLCSYARKEVN